MDVTLLLGYLGLGLMLAWQVSEAAMEQQSQQMQQKAH